MTAYFMIAIKTKYQSSKGLWVIWAPYSVLPKGSSICSCVFLSIHTHTITVKDNHLTQTHRYIHNLTYVAAHVFYEDYGFLNVIEM